jgi:hypothetical protein
MACWDGDDMRGWIGAKCLSGHRSLLW